MPVTATASPVFEGIYRFSSGISNFYLVEEGGKLFLVDAGASGDWALFARGLTTLRRSPTDLEAILLTHAHSDHTGFSERARNEVGALVWVHEADQAVARGAPQGKNEGRYRTYVFRAEFWRTLFGLMRHGGVKIVPIHHVRTFADRQEIDAPGRPRAVHLPGHTPGMAAVFLERRRVLLTGDSLITRNPLTGRRGPQVMPRALNVDTRQALQSLDGLEGLTADVILPGHGDPWTDGVARAVALAREAGPS